MRSEETREEKKANEKRMKSNPRSSFILLPIPIFDVFWFVEIIKSGFLCPSLSKNFNKIVKGQNYPNKLNFAMK